MRRHVLLPPLVAVGVALGFAACRPNATAVTPATAATTEPFRVLPVAQSATLPDRLADSTWWRMVRDMSEPGGYFRSENFVSNEMGLQHVIARLRVTSPPGGVYVGVGPEQNFTYIAFEGCDDCILQRVECVNCSSYIWFGLLGPKAMDAQTVERLNAAVRQVLEMPEIAGRLTASGNTVRIESPQQFRETVKADRARWAGVVRQVGVTID